MNHRSGFVAAVLTSSLLQASADELAKPIFTVVDDETAVRIADSKISEDPCTKRLSLVTVDLEALARGLDFAQKFDDPLETQPVLFELFEDLTVKVRPISIRSSSLYGFYQRVVWYQGTEIGADESLPIEYGVSGMLNIKDGMVTGGIFGTVSWTVAINPAAEQPYLEVNERDIENCSFDM